MSHSRRRPPLEVNADVVVEIAGEAGTWQDSYFEGRLASSGPPSLLVLLENTVQAVDCFDLLTSG